MNVYEFLILAVTLVSAVGCVAALAWGIRGKN